MSLIVSKDDWLVATDQEAIDRVYDLFVREMKPRCTNPRGGCDYFQTDHPCGCAVGCLVNPVVRRNLAHHTGYVKMSHRQGFFDFPCDLTGNALERLQNWHDVDLAEFSDQKSRHASFPFLDRVTNSLTFEVSK